MKFFWSLVVVSLLAGCNSTKFVRADYAYGSQFALAKQANDFSKGYKADGNPKFGLPLDGHYLSLMFGAENYLFSDIVGALMLGPAGISPTKGPDTEFLSVEARLRFTYTKLRVQPFIQGLAGIGFSHKQKWEGEGTQLLYSTGGTLGFGIPFDKDKWRIDVGYSFYHISNGATIFGAKSPNAGYNTDMIIFGVERKF
jgi:hypothetical protein